MKNTLSFLNEAQVRDLGKIGTPTYVVSKKLLKERASDIINAMKTLPFGGSLSFAMKANPHPDVLKLFAGMGIGIDASSYYEALAAISAGVNPKTISLTSQELPKNESDFTELIEKGVHFNATSLQQLKVFCTLFPGKSVGVRVNPGIGSGYNMRLSTGGVTAGFGVWYEYIDEAIALAAKYNVSIVRVHTHIGTGTDPMEWRRALAVTLELAEKFKDLETVNIGGGFKAKYMDGDYDANMSDIMNILSSELLSFEEKTNKKIRLEIEPGRLLVVHAGVIISKVIDITDTGKEGYSFIRIDTGMTEIIRSAMYGAQHPLVVVPQTEEHRDEKEYVVVGHCCESSDCLTTVKGDPESIEPRLLTEAKIGDYLVIEKTGAYCYGMSALRYNSFPEAPVVFME